MSTQIATAEILENKVAEAAKAISGIPLIIQVSPDNTDTETLTLDEAKELIWERLELLGIYKDAESHELLLSDDCQEGEGRRVFCENGQPSLPSVRFKRVWSILTRGLSLPDDEENPEGSIDYNALQAGLPDLAKAVAEAVAPAKPVGQWSDEELIKTLTPDGRQDVIDELNKRAHNRPFVAYKKGGDDEVETGATLRMLREARRRDIPVHFQFSDVLFKLHRAGDFPSVSFTECPLHPRTLLLDGYCDDCGHSWEGVKYETMQFVRLVSESGGAPSDPASIRQLIQSAMTDMKDLRADYAKVALMFDDLKEDGKLPELKRRTAAPIESSIHGTPWGTQVRHPKTSISTGQGGVAAGSVARFYGIGPDTRESPR